MKHDHRGHAAAARRISMIFLTLALTGCAVGNKYDYQESDIAIPVSGDESIGLTVVDRRPYVLSGDKPSSFIGLQRGGFGNPFNVTTESGRSLAAEVQDALSTALRKRGFDVTVLYPASVNDPDILQAIEKRGRSENVVLVFREWKTDAMMSLGLSYDMVLRILGPDGTELAASSTQGDNEKLGTAGFENQNAKVAKRAMEDKIQQLFSDPSVLKALGMD